MWKWILGLGLVGFIGLLIAAGCIFMWGVGISNAEIGQRNLVVAKQKSNTVEFDNMYKKNMEAFDITQAQKDAIYQIIVGNAHERSNQAKGSLAAMVKEVVPDVSKMGESFDKLMNIVVASRNEWTTKQNQLVDLNRVHDNMIDQFPSSLVCATILGRQKIVIQLVTSDRTDDAFRTGHDNQVGFKPTGVPSLTPAPAPVPATK